MSRWFLPLAIPLLLVGCSRAGRGTGSDGDAAATSIATTTVPAGPTPSTTTPPTVRSSTGCGAEPRTVAPAEPSGDVPLSMDVGGSTRTYRLAVPSSYDPASPAPLIVNLHGSGSNAVEHSYYSQLPRRGAERGAIVVSPDAIDGQWELTGNGPDDDFLMALLDDAEAHYCVDLDRVHASGISLGAWKATITACTHPDRFASIGLVAEEVAPFGCAIPVVAFHGTADRVVPYGAGADPGIVVTGRNAQLPGVEVNMPAWAANAGCSTEPDITRIEPDVAHWTYPGCRPGLSVELYSIDHGGHTWPGSPIEIGPTTTTIDATSIILDFFAAHPRTR